MSEYFLFSTGIELLMALSVGVVIGIERQISTKHTRKKYGMRDFSLIALLAFLASFLDQYQPHVWSLTFVSIIVLTLLIFSFDSLKRSKEHPPGITTVLTFPLVFLISSLSVFHFEFWLIATLLFIVLIILELKETWHGFASTIEKHEFFDFSILIAIALVITPLIPEGATITIPLYNFSTHEFSFFHESVSTFWKVVIMVSMMSFVAHFITKHIRGKNALLFASFFGGLVSSLATIILFLKNQKGKTIPQKNIFLGYLAASTGSLTKDILILYGIVSTAFFELMLFPLAAILLFLIVSTIYTFSHSHSEQVQITHRPLPLSFIIKFSSIFAVLTIVLIYINYYFGDGATVVASFFSGMVSSIASLGAISSAFEAQNISALIAGMSIMLAITGSIFAKYLFIARRVGVKKSFSFLLPLFGMMCIGGVGMYFSFFS